MQLTSRVHQRLLSILLTAELLKFELHPGLASLKTRRSKAKRRKMLGQEV